jgi:predicted transcriptional regulator
MKTYDVRSVDIGVCAKKDIALIKVATRIVLDLFNVIPIINDDG